MGLGFFLWCKREQALRSPQGVALSLSNLPLSLEAFGWYFLCKEEALVQKILPLQRVAGTRAAVTGCPPLQSQQH